MPNKNLSLLLFLLFFLGFIGLFLLPLAGADSETTAAGAAMEQKNVSSLQDFMEAEVFKRAGNTLAVMPLSASSDLQEEAKLITEQLSIYFSQSDAFLVIQDETRDALIREMKFSLNDISAKETELQIGELLSARYLLTGSLYTRGSVFILNLNMVSVENGSVVHSMTETFNSLNELYFNLSRVTDSLSSDKLRDKNRIDMLSLDFGLGLYSTDQDIEATGLEAGLLYRFAPELYLGAWIGGIIKKDTSLYADGGIKAVFGDKTNGLALSLDIGFFPSAGMYYKNFYLKYAPMYLFGKNGQYVKAGYSIGIR